MPSVNANVNEEDIEPEGEYILMLIDAEKIKDLCELYPGTEAKLKYRSLDRRNFFLSHMDKKWNEEIKI